MYGLPSTSKQVAPGRLVEGLRWKCAVPYDLLAMVLHDGRTPRSGHYFTVVHIEGAWIRCNDSSVTVLREDPRSSESRRTYVLAYVRRDTATEAADSDTMPDGDGGDGSDGRDDDDAMGSAGGPADPADDLAGEPTDPANEVASGDVPSVPSSQRLINWPPGAEAGERFLTSLDVGRGDHY